LAPYCRDPRRRCADFPGPATYGNRHGRLVDGVTVGTPQPEEEPGWVNGKCEVAWLRGSGSGRFFAFLRGLEEPAERAGHRGGADRAVGRAFPLVTPHRGQHPLGQLQRVAAVLARHPRPAAGLHAIDEVPQLGGELVALAVAVEAERLEIPPE